MHRWKVSDLMAFSLRPRSSAAFQSCLCHKSGVQGPVTEFSSVSWKTFKSAAEVREDDISKSMKGKWEFGPFGGYHRKCYQNYTAKSHIERVVTKRRKIDEDDSTVTVAEQEEESDVRLTRSSLQSTIIQMCWICQAEKTDTKDRRRKERLTNCQTMNAGSTLLDAAKARNDQRLMVALHNKDPVAVEVCYHKSCYRYYTNIKQLEISKSQEEDMNIFQYDAAFQQLKEEIEPQLFQNFEVLHMSDLQQMYVEKLRIQGKPNP